MEECLIFKDTQNRYMLTPLFLKLSKEEKIIFKKLYDMSSQFLSNKITISSLPVQICFYFFDYCHPQAMYLNGHQIVSEKIIERLKAIYHDAGWPVVEPNYTLGTFVLELKSNYDENFKNTIEIHFRGDQGKILPQKTLSIHVNQRIEKNDYSNHWFG